MAARASTAAQTGSSSSSSTVTVKQRQLAVLADRLGELSKRTAALDEQVQLASEHALVMRQYAAHQAALCVLRRSAALQLNPRLIDTRPASWPQNASFCPSQTSNSNNSSTSAVVSERDASLGPVQALNLGLSQRANTLGRSPGLVRARLWNISRTVLLSTLLIPSRLTIDFEESRIPLASEADSMAHRQLLAKLLALASAMDWDRDQPSDNVNMQSSTADRCSPFRTMHAARYATPGASTTVAYKVLRSRIDALQATSADCDRPSAKSLMLL